MPHKSSAKRERTVMLMTIVACGSIASFSFIEIYNCAGSLLFRQKKHTYIPIIKKERGDRIRCPFYDLRP